MCGGIYVYCMGRVLLFFISRISNRLQCGHCQTLQAIWFDFAIGYYSLLGSQRDTVLWQQTVLVLLQPSLCMARSYFLAPLSPTFDCTPLKTPPFTILSTTDTQCAGVQRYSTPINAQACSWMKLAFLCALVWSVFLTATFGVVKIKQTLRVNLTPFSWDSVA